MLVLRFSLLLLLLLAFGVHASVYDPAQRKDVAEFINEMVRDQGMDRQHLESLFSEARKRQDILDLIARPAERVLQWHEYREIFVTRQRIEAGRRFMEQYAEALQRAEREYGVPPEIITSIIGVETFYGRNKGRHRVIDALATLTFDYPPRAPFFRGQLVEFLHLTQRHELNPRLPMGSYAGAMGYPQFIPTSYRDFAVDFDGDGFADIWTNPVDAIGSVGSYFKAHGWRAGEPVVMPFRLAANAELPELRINRFNLQPMAELRKAGVQPNRPLADDVRALPMAFALQEGELHLLGLQNFYVITRYNHSRMYALAVTELAEALRN
ncbi:lytic murein transglycosylase B [Marinospirillum alkaliphilum]|uniref:Membrane-bound lytic murein transglycosylase B n=1 Tax=Marinospirillum alkaliphilum DSM 21637 TaxID=1122209 RepID=A0A1K1YM79_9GAMM|nr:lytic murein transglycosylase B [Marinospirillum alkaliphilum]SFX62904.1 membrane-bound lytic murein transglycosylase B [Marinospirillum alkaliphilum DSM 21637]